MDEEPRVKQLGDGGHGGLALDKLAEVFLTQCVEKLVEGHGIHEEEADLVTTSTSPLEAQRGTACLLVVFSFPLVQFDS